MLGMPGGSREGHDGALPAGGSSFLLFGSRRKKGCGWAGIGPKGQVALCFVGLARKIEEGEMGGLHSWNGPNAITLTGKHRNLFKILAAEVNRFKMNLNESFSTFSKVEIWKLVKDLVQINLNSWFGIFQN
jgi:hypothetical protein